MYVGDSPAAHRDLGRLAGGVAFAVLARGAGRLAGTAAASARRGPGGRWPVALGAAGEAAVRRVAEIGSRVRIQVGGRVRIPDGLTGSVLTEVKNVRSPSYTRQLRDFAEYARSHGLRFDLWVRASTQLSSTLAAAVARGDINLRIIPP